MKRWCNKVAVVTGASSGIGAAIAIDLVKSGVIVIGLARRHELVEDLKSNLGEFAKNLHAYKCDVSKEENVKAAFNWIDENFGSVSILVNNAGLAKSTMILNDETSNEDIQGIVGTNLLGLMYCIREAYRSMKKYDADGYIININSVLGHKVPAFPMMQTPYNMYPGTKYAITATNEVIRQELNYLQNKKIRISSLSPGYVQTEIFRTAGLDSNFPVGTPALQPEDISQSVLFILSTPSHVQIQELIIKPVGDVF